MPTLKTGTGSIDVSNARIVCQAERMGKLSPPRRAHRLEKAKAALASGGSAKGGKRKAAKSQVTSPVMKRAAAILLSQGVGEV